MTEQRTPDGLQTRRADRSLPPRVRDDRPAGARSCRSPATRRTANSFRVITPDDIVVRDRRCMPARSISPTLPFAERRGSAASDAAAGAADLRPLGPARHRRQQDLGDVTLQAHLGAASPAEHAALYRQAVALIERLQRRGAELRIRAVPALPDRLRRREADVGARVLRQAFRRGVSRRRAEPGRASGAQHGVAGDRQRARGRPASAVSPRLSQPQPDAPRRAASTSSTSRTRAWGRTPTISCRCCATRTWTSPIAIVDELIAYFLALNGRGADGRRRVPPPLRPDGAAAEPQGARHVRLPDRHTPQSRVYPVHPADAALCAHQPREAIRGSRVCASCWRLTSRNCASAGSGFAVRGSRSAASGYRLASTSDTDSGAITCSKLRRMGSQRSS